MSEERSSLNTHTVSVWFNIALLLSHRLRCWSGNVQTLDDLFTESTQQQGGAASLCCRLKANDSIQTTE